MISIVTIIILAIKYQLSLKSDGAKNPRMYSSANARENNIDNDIRNASLSTIILRMYKSAELRITTPQFKHTLNKS